MKGKETAATTQFKSNDKNFILNFNLNSDKNYWGESEWDRLIKLI